jgi:hypothetical protein
MKRIQKELPVRLSDEELKERANTMAHQERSVEQYERDLKEIKSRFKNRIDAARAEIGRLADEITDGKTNRLVDCVLLLDTPVKGKKALKRMDTGELVEVTDMTGEDAQRDLIGEELLPQANP